MSCSDCQCKTKKIKQAYECVECGSVQVIHVPLIDMILNVERYVYCECDGECVPNDWAFLKLTDEVKQLIGINPDATTKEVQ